MVIRATLNLRWFQIRLFIETELNSLAGERKKEEFRRYAKKYGARPFLNFMEFMMQQPLTFSRYPNK